MFVGRWQTLHQGHDWLFNQRLNQGQSILICIRDVPISEKDLLSAEEVKVNLEERYSDLIESGNVKLLIIPDVPCIYPVPSDILSVNPDTDERVEPVIAPIGDPSNIIDDKFVWDPSSNVTDIFLVISNSPSSTSRNAQYTDVLLLVIFR